MGVRVDSEGPAAGVGVPDGLKPGLAPGRAGAKPRKEAVVALSKRQKDILRFIENYIIDHHYPPTIREIGDRLRISSTSVVNYNLNKLQEAGLIERDGQVSRGLKLTYPVPRAPVLGTIAAGEPIPVPESLVVDQLPEDVEWVELTREIARHGDEIYALYVKGDSMIGDLVNDGDIVVLQKAETAENGEMVAAWLTDREEATLKRIYREDGQIRLQPSNPRMEPIYVDPEHIQVKGKVIAVIRSLS